MKFSLLRVWLIAMLMFAVGLAIPIKFPSLIDPLQAPQGNWVVVSSTNSLVLQFDLRSVKNDNGVFTVKVREDAIGNGGFGATSFATITARCSTRQVVVSDIDVYDITFSSKTTVKVPAVEQDPVSDATIAVVAFFCGAAPKSGTTIKPPKLLEA